MNEVLDFFPSDKFLIEVNRKNVNMKQDINLGKVNNQNFVQIPIMRFAEMIKYKCELEGITVTYHEESYTSKCSFF